MVGEQRPRVPPAPHCASSIMLRRRVQIITVSFRGSSRVERHVQSVALCDIHLLFLRALFSAVPPTTIQGRRPVGPAVKQVRRAAAQLVAQRVPRAAPQPVDKLAPQVAVVLRRAQAAAEAREQAAPPVQPRVAWMRRTRCSDPAPRPSLPAATNQTRAEPAPTRMTPSAGPTVTSTSAVVQTLACTAQATPRLA